MDDRMTAWYLTEAEAQQVADLLPYDAVRVAQAPSWTVVEGDKSWYIEVGDGVYCDDGEVRVFA